MKTDVKTWVIDWFAEHTSLKQEEFAEKMGENYLEKGWIDSLAFISFINDIEEQFHLHFLNEEFQDRSFATIEGIIKTIEKKLHGKI